MNHKTNYVPICVRYGKIPFRFFNWVVPGAALSANAFVNYLESPTTFQLTSYITSENFRPDYLTFGAAYFAAFFTTAIAAERLVPRVLHANKFGVSRGSKVLRAGQAVAVAFSLTCGIVAEKSIMPPPVAEAIPRPVDRPSRDWRVLPISIKTHE